MSSSATEALSGQRLTQATDTWVIACIYDDSDRGSEAEIVVTYCGAPAGDFDGAGKLTAADIDRFRRSLDSDS